MITFDIETLQCTDIDAIAELAATIKPPATYKKQDTIDKWFEENKESELKELIAKTSFNSILGSVACIAWQHNDGDVFSTMPNESEGDIIQHFYDSIDAYKDSNFCGQNIAGFDLPFLKHRSMILYIKPPSSLLAAMNAKPWDNCIQDTMLMWSPDREKRASMDKLCKAFGIAGKDGFDGSMVNAEWTTGDRNKVIEYCKDDVRRTREIYKRLTFA
jgi:predicted PolB exonuclease-like 3'-5' exonuclease